MVDELSKQYSPEMQKYKSEPFSYDKVLTPEFYTGDVMTQAPALAAYLIPFGWIGTMRTL